MAVSRHRQFAEEKGICHLTKAAITKLPEPNGRLRDVATRGVVQGIDIMEDVSSDTWTFLTIILGSKSLKGGQRLRRDHSERGIENDD
jgi:hypothetical protein